MSDYWWETNTGELYATIDLLNESASEPDLIKKFNSSFDALMLLARAYDKVADIKRGNESGQLKQLLSRGIESEHKHYLARHESLKGLSMLRPLVKNLSPQPGKPATWEHETFIEAYGRYFAQTPAPSASEMLTALGAVVWVIREVEAVSGKSFSLKTSQPSQTLSEKPMLDVVLPILRQACYAVLGVPDTVLAAYGTLRPGEVNHNIVKNIGGNWADGTIQGEVSISGMYPVFEPKTSGGHPIKVGVLTSADLPRHWQAIDDFEGSSYRRVLCPIKIGNRVVVGNVYATTTPANKLSRAKA